MIYRLPDDWYYPWNHGRTYDLSLDFFQQLYIYMAIYIKTETAMIANHYDDVIMTTMAAQITSLTVVYSTVYSDANQRKHQSSASLAFVWGIHRDRWIPRTKGQLRGNVSIWWRHHTMAFLVPFEEPAIIQTGKDNLEICLNMYECDHYWTLNPRWYFSIWINNGL